MIALYMREGREDYRSVRTSTMDELLRSSAAFVEDNTALVWSLLAVSISSIVAVALLLPGIVARLPADYFASARTGSSERATALNWAKHVGRNVLGVILVLAGIAMLFLPGQGVLTVLIGVFLVDFPGKGAVERAVLRRERVRRILNRMRAKRGQPPLDLD